MRLQQSLRRAGATSIPDAALQATRYVAILFAVGFALYLPVSKYQKLSTTPKVIWYVLYVSAVLFAQLFPYLPKVGKRGWKRAETARLQSTNVAISRMTNALVNGQLKEEEFVETARGLLTAIKLEVQAIVLESDSTYINATLMAEDSLNPNNLCTLSRANADRPHASYAKSGLLLWKSMETKVPQYLSKFHDPTKEYRCILVFPIVTRTKAGHELSVGAVSIDSGTAGDFDTVQNAISTRITPYLSLLGMLLALRKVKKVTSW